MEDICLPSLDSIVSMPCLSWDSDDVCSAPVAGCPAVDLRGTLLSARLDLGEGSLPLWMSPVLQGLELRAHPAVCLAEAFLKMAGPAVSATPGGSVSLALAAGGEARFSIEPGRPLPALALEVFLRFALSTAWCAPFLEPRALGERCAREVKNVDGEAFWAAVCRGPLVSPPRRLGEPQNSAAFRAGWTLLHRGDAEAAEAHLRMYAAALSGRSHGGLVVVELGDETALDYVRSAVLRAFGGAAVSTEHSLLSRSRVPMLLRKDLKLRRLVMVTRHELKVKTLRNVAGSRAMTVVQAAGRLDGRLDQREAGAVRAYSMSSADIAAARLPPAAYMADTLREVAESLPPAPPPDADALARTGLEVGDPPKAWIVALVQEMVGRYGVVKPEELIQEAIRRRPEARSCVVRRDARQAPGIRCKYLTGNRYVYIPSDFRRD